MILPDNPGQNHADSFYLVVTTDKETVLEGAQKVDGVLAYVSDLAAPTASCFVVRMEIVFHKSSEKSGIIF